MQHVLNSNCASARFTPITNELVSSLEKGLRIGANFAISVGTWDRVLT